MPAVSLVCDLIWQVTLRRFEMGYHAIQTFNHQTLLYFTQENFAGKNVQTSTFESILSESVTRFGPVTLGLL